jgi:lipopolysaccharide transport system permease protein
MNPHERHRSSLIEACHSFWRNRGLIWQMTRRDVVGRYRGSVIGLAWSFFNPLLMLVVYTLVFGAVFKMRWSSTDGQAGNLGFAIVLFIGMIIHGLFAECVQRAPGLVLSNVNYVKKVVFPLETLPIVALGAALFHTIISLIVLLVILFSVNGHLYWTALLLPIILFPLVVMTLGVGWFLASLGVFVRDVGQTIGILTAVMLFLSPVFYPRSALPAEYRPWLLVNPLTLVIEQARDVLVWGRPPDWSSLVLFSLASLAVAWVGFWWFQRTRSGFADVL